MKIKGCKKSTHYGVADSFKKIVVVKDDSIHGMMNMECYISGYNNSY